MVIENVSIVNNYRAQFDRVIAKSSVKELLQKMKGQDS
jgi:ABC-type transporter MlaC component